MRPRGKARSLEDCLKADSAMARLSSHAARLVELQALLASALPANLARAARVANVKSGKLVIHADNGAVAAKLRQMTPRLASLFAFQGGEVTGIDIRVQARSRNPANSTPRTPTGVSSPAKRALTTLESTLPEGSRLRLALARLIERG
jgi:hypothetical protein